MHVMFLRGKKNTHTHTHTHAHTRARTRARTPPKFFTFGPFPCIPKKKKGRPRSWRICGVRGPLEGGGLGGGFLAKFFMFMPFLRGQTLDCGFDRCSTDKMLYVMNSNRSYSRMLKVWALADALFAMSQRVRTSFDSDTCSRAASTIYAREQRRHNHIKSPKFLDSRVSLGHQADVPAKCPVFNSQTT